MNREQAEKLLGALIFDDLDEQSRARLLAYLETDADLRESLADLRMALKVTTDAIQQGPDPVLSDTRLKRLERLSQSKGHPRVMLVLRLTAVAATIAIVAGAILIPSLNSVKVSSLAVTDNSRKRNLDLEGDATLADASGSIVKNWPSRGSGRAAVADGESASDGLGRAGVQAADKARQMPEAASRSFTPGLEVARQTESLGLPQSPRDLNDDLASFGSSSVTANDKFYAYAEATQPRTSQPVDGVLSWNRAGQVRGEGLQKQLSSEAQGRSRGQSVDLYAMDAAKAQQALGGRIAEDSAGPAGGMTGLASPKRTPSAWAYDSAALGQQTQGQTSLSRGGVLPSEPRDGLPVDVLSSMSGAPRAARPVEPALSVPKTFEGPVAWHERLPSKPEQEAQGGSSRYGRGLAREESADRSSSSRPVTPDRPALRLADEAPEVASLSKRLRRLESASGLGTDGRQAGGDDAFGEKSSRLYDVAANSLTLNMRTDLKSDAQSDFGFSEAKVTVSRHGFGLEAKAAEKVAVLGDVPLVGGLFRSADGGMMGDGMRGGGAYGDQMPGGSMGGGMMGGMMGGGMGGGSMGHGILPLGLQTKRELAVSSGEASGPQQVLLQTQVVTVDDAALQDLGFEKEALEAGSDTRVWSDQAGKAGLDSVITKLKQKDQLTVVATPSTLAQNGKPSSVAVIAEEYFMLTESPEESTKGIKLNLTSRVEENQKIALDVDMGAMPQARTSTVPQSGVRSNTVSLNDGDSVILVNPERTLSGPDQTQRREAVIVTANLLPDKQAQPEGHSAQTLGEFTLAPASRFKQMPVNPWVLSEQDALSTFALDVDTASYALCRQYIQHGFLPPAGAVRMEEFVNAFDYAYPQRSEPTFSVMAEGTRSPFAEPGQALSLVKIAVKARTVGRDQRKAAHLVFVVDASASMGQADRLPLIQQGLSRLVEELGPQDRVSLVSCSDQARLLLDHVPARDRDVVVQAVHAIQPSGSTNLLAGLQLGYATAKTSYVAGQINQVILCSDGVANVGATEAESVLEAVSADRQQGIMLMCVGVGYGAYNDVLLEALANQGDGRYVFVDGADQVERVFVQPLASALQTVAKDARIQVKFNPDVVRRYRLVGYENRDIKDEQFRDDTVDAGEVGSGQCATALYEIEFRNNQSGSGDLATVFVRYQDTDTQQFEEISRPLALTLVKTRTVAQSPRFYLAASAARFAEWLRQSEHAKTTTLDQILSITDEISAALPLDRDIQELADLIRQAEGLPRAP